MALSSESKTFRDTFEKVKELAREDNLNKETYEQLLANNNIDKEDFKQATQEFKQMTPEEKEGPAQITGLPVVDPVLRLGGRAFGQAGRGIADFTKAVAPGVANTFSKVADKVGEYVPEEVKDFADELFDPYHGDGVYGTGEEAVGNILSYFVPATGIVKGVNVTTKGINALSKGNKAVRAALKPLKAVANTRAAKVAGYGTIGAASATLVEDPADNAVNLIREQFPESTQYLERFAVDPEDTEAKQYLNSFLNNLGFEAVAIGGLGALGKAYQKIKKFKKARTAPSKLENLFSTRRGMSDENLAKFVKVEAASKNSFEEALAESKELEAILKRNNLTTDEDLLKVNNALEGKRVVGLPTEVRDKVKAMRNNIDDLSQFFMDSNRTSGRLKTTIGKNLKTYLTRTYEMFDNPDYVKQLEKALKKNRKAIQRGELDSISNDAIRSGTSYLVDDLGFAPTEAANALEETLKKYSGKAGFDTGDFLLDLGGKAERGESSVKAFKKKKIIPDKLKAFLGEVKDPSVNYVNAYNKLASYKAEVNFLEELADDMVRTGAAERVTRKKGVPLLSDSAVKKDFVDAKDIVDNRLSKVFGRGSVTQGTIKNPFDNLYIDKNYATTLAEGLDALDPAKSLASKYYLKLKVASQLGKTVYNPGTHAINVLGNNVFMVSNGFIPGTTGVKDAAQFVIKKFGGINNKDLIKKFNKYRELGVTGSDIAVETIRSNIDRIAARPDVYLKKTKRLTSLPNKFHQKMVDIYQMEDDIYKIMHFESTKKDLAKAFPDLSTEAIEKMAGQRTRDLMPNYRIAPKAVKKLRGWIVGDFATFATESARVAKNLVKYTVQDALSGNAVLAKAAAKRLAGMTAAGMGGNYLANKSRILNNVTDEEDEALDMIGPSYDYGVDRIHLTGRTKQGGRTVYNTVSLGSLDPFMFPKMAAKLSHRLFFDPKYSPATEEGRANLANFNNDPELQKMSLALWDKTLSPIMGTSIATDAILDAIQGVRGRNTDYADVAAKFFQGAFAPSFVQFIANRSKYEEEAKAKEPGLREKGYPADSLFSERTKGVPGETDWASLLGIKNRLIDVDSSVRFNIDSNLSRLNSNSKLQKLLKGQRSQAFNVKKYFDKDGYQINLKDFIDTKFKDEKIRKRKMREMQMYLDGYSKLGLNPNDILTILKKNPRVNLSDKKAQTLMAIQNDKFIPDTVTKEDALNYYRILKEMGIENPLGVLSDIDSKIMNTPIRKRNK